MLSVAPSTWMTSKDSIPMKKKRSRSLTFGRSSTRRITLFGLENTNSNQNWRKSIWAVTLSQVGLFRIVDKKGKLVVIYLFGPSWRYTNHKLNCILWGNTCFYWMKTSGTTSAPIITMAYTKRLLTVKTFNWNSF